MTKPLTKITEEQFENLCFWFHKGCRWSGTKGSSELWHAIDRLEDGEGELGSYSAIMKNALRQANIKVLKNKEVKHG